MALFAVSTAFPIVASALTARSRPRWLGIADVAMAAGLTATAIFISAIHGPRATDADRLQALKATQWLIGLIPALLLLFFVVGQRLDWTVLVIGVGWRAWLLLYTLPALFAARRAAGSRSGSQGDNLP